MILLYRDIIVSARERQGERKGVTAICEAPDKDAAMTAVLTEQWGVSVRIPLDLYSARHPFQRTAELCTRCAFATSNWRQIATSKQPPLLSGRVPFDFSFLWGGYWQFCLEKCDFFIPTLEPVAVNACGRRLGLNPSLTDDIVLSSENICIHSHARRPRVEWTDDYQSIFIFHRCIGKNIPDIVPIDSAGMMVKDLKHFQ